MKLYIDSADLSEIKNLKNAPFVSGITTNPKLIAKGIGKTDISCEEYFEYLQKIRKVIHGEMFIQLTSQNKKDIIEEANTVRDTLRGPIVFKVPATAQGFHAISHLAKEGFSVSATAVYTASQAYISIASGAKYVIPYFSKIDKQNQQGIDTLREIMSISGSDKLLVASIKNEAALYYLLMEGVRNFTLPYPLLMQIAECDLTIDSINEFNKNLNINWNKKK